MKPKVKVGASSRRVCDPGRQGLGTVAETTEGQSAPRMLVPKGTPGIPEGGRHQTHPEGRSSWLMEGEKSGTFDPASHSSRLEITPALSPRCPKQVPGTRVTERRGAGPTACLRRPPASPPELVRLDLYSMFLTFTFNFTTNFFPSSADHSFMSDFFFLHY